MIIKKAKEAIENYLVDAANYRGLAEAVYFPESTEDISAILKDANQNSIRVTVSGNGTGLTGGRVPENGIVIATDKLNEIIEINESEMYAVLQPGVLLSELQSELRQRKLYYPPDPTEQNCFIGGTVATNASGAKTFKYGPTRKFVDSLKVILPDGEIKTFVRGMNLANGYKLEFESENGKKYSLDIPQYEMPATKHAAGYYCHENMDAIDLFIGSEGTLGVVTEIKLRLLDQPQNFLSSVLFFDDENDALNFISGARDRSFETCSQNKFGIDALGLEFFDDHSLRFLSGEYAQIPTFAKAAVWFEQETKEENEQKIFDLWIELIEQHNCNTETAWFASSEKERRKFQEFRHAVSSKVNEYISGKNIRKVGTDTAVPDKNFKEFYFEAQKMVESTGLNYVAYGHFGNSHLHLNMLPGNDAEYRKAKEIYKAICDLAVKLKGTISAEHGIGKLKREYLLKMFGEENIMQMARLKKQLDPNMILGIGNIFDEEFSRKV